MEQQNKDQNISGKLVKEVQKILAEKDEKIVNLEEEIRELKAKMAKKETYIKELKSSIRRRGIPTELMNELFASLPIENAFALLVKMPNGILARNVQKMNNGIKEALKYNKLNTEDCGPHIIIHEDGLVAKHFDGPFKLICLRALLPIPTFNFRALNKSRIAFYFEMEVLNTFNGIMFGFCDKQFPLESEDLGRRYNSNSIGILSNIALLIDGCAINDDYINDEDNRYFVKSDFAGLGIIHLPNAKMEVFATLNGELLGKADLPPKFVDLQLFPAFNLRFPVDSIRAHFKKEEWKFNDFKSVLE